MATMASGAQNSQRTCRYPLTENKSSKGPPSLEEKLFHVPLLSVWIQIL